MVRQKNINSLESLLISETKYINWNCTDMMSVVEILITRLKEQNKAVSKASEQALLTLLKLEGFERVYNKLTQEVKGIMNQFIEEQKSLNQLGKEYSLEEGSSEIYQRIQQVVLNEKNYNRGVIDVERRNNNRSNYELSSHSPIQQIQQKIPNQQQNNEIFYEPQNFNQSENRQRQVNKPSKPSQSNIQYISSAQKSDNYSEDDLSDNGMSQQTKSTFSKPIQRKKKDQADSRHMTGEMYTQPVYVSQEELQQIPDAENQIKFVISELKYDDWQRQFDAIDQVRAMIKWHIQVIRRNLAPVMSEIIKLSENLRSGVSKNSLICLQEASLILKKELDPFLEPAMMKLIKKSQDSNSFISEEVRRVMITLIISCSEMKCIQLLANAIQNKSIPVKLNLANCIAQLLNKLGSAMQTSNQQQVEKLIQLNCLYAVDQSNEVRQIAKDCLFSLMSTIPKQNLYQMITKMANDKDAVRIKGILDKGPNQDATSSEFKRFQSMGSSNRQNKTPDIKNEKGSRTVSNILPQQSQNMSLRRKQ